MGCTSSTSTQQDGTYLAFISHCKADASMAAVFFKQALSLHLQHGNSKKKYELFLDSDNLHDLDQLLQAVEDSGTLLVLLSESYLSRPWCLLELWTAVSKGKNLVPVSLAQHSGKHTFDFERAQTYADDLRSAPGINDQILEILQGKGAGVEAVQSAVGRLLGIIASPFDAAAAENVREAQLDNIFKKTLAGNSNNPDVSQMKKKAFLEAVAAAEEKNANSDPPASKEKGGSQTLASPATSPPQTVAAAEDKYANSEPPAPNKEKGGSRSLATPATSPPQEVLCQVAVGADGDNNKNPPVSDRENSVSDKKDKETGIEALPSAMGRLLGIMKKKSEAAESAEEAKLDNIFKKALAANSSNSAITLRKNGGIQVDSEEDNADSHPASKEKSGSQTSLTSPEEVVCKVVLRTADSDDKNSGSDDEENYSDSDGEENTCSDEEEQAPTRKPTFGFGGFGPIPPARGAPDLARDFSFGTIPPARGASGFSFGMEENTCSDEEDQAPTRKPASGFFGPICRFSFGSFGPSSDEEDQAPTRKASLFGSGFGGPFVFGRQQSLFGTPL